MSLATLNIYRSRRIIVSAAVVAFSLASGRGLAIPTSSAQQNWTEPALLYEGTDLADAPAIVMEPGGVGHLFWPVNPEHERGSGGAIFYSMWDGSAWHDPVDVLVSPQGGIAGSVRVALGPDGYLYVAWIGGGRLYTSRALASHASAASEWSEPMELALSATEDDIGVDAQGAIHILYVGPNVYTVVSLDAGRSWSNPVSLSQVSRGEQYSSHPRLAIDAKNRPHAVWTLYQLPQGWPPLGVQYARSDDGGTSWTEPLDLTTGSFGQAAIATFGNDQVHVVWRSTSDGAGAFHRYSDDGGANWTTANNFDPEGPGFSGPQSLAFDARGSLHFVRSDVAYNVWTDGRWQYGSSVPLTPVQGNGAFEERAQIGVGKGVIVVVYRDGSLHNIGYAVKQADVEPATNFTLRVAPTSADEPELMAHATDSASTLAPPLVRFPRELPARGGLSESLALFSGLSAAIVVVVSAAAIHRWRDRKRRS